MNLLLIGGIIVLLGLLIWGVVRFSRFLDLKHEEYVEQKNQEAKEFLDKFEAACNALPVFSGIEFPEPLIVRSHDHRIKIVEKNVDKANAIMTAYVVVQFNQQTRRFELRHYHIEFLRSGGQVKNLLTTKRLGLEWMDFMVIEAMTLYSDSFQSVKG